MKTITHILEITKDKLTGQHKAVVEYSVKDWPNGSVKDMGWRSMNIETMPYVGMIISEGC